MIRGRRPPTLNLPGSAPTTWSMKPPTFILPGQEEGLGRVVWCRGAPFFSSALGGTAAAVTRYLVGDADPLTLAILRWGIGFLCVLPVAIPYARGMAEAKRLAGSCRTWVSAFSGCSSSSTISLSATPRRPARASRSRHCRCRATLVGALLGAELLTWRKTAGVAIAMLGSNGSARIEGLGGSAARLLARGVDHDRGSPLHGGLQRVVASLDEKIECARFPDCWHGMRSGSARPGWPRQRTA